MSSLRDEIAVNLASAIGNAVVEQLLSSYEELVAKHKIGDLQGALTSGGRFVEHVLRAIEFLRTGQSPPEIKSVRGKIQEIENDISLQESIRLIIPRVLYGMIYNIRSKRNAVHVKDIDPSGIDVAMGVSAASWTIAELIRLYHSSDNESVEECMLALSRTSMPFIESIDGEAIVGRKVDPRTEMLLLLSHAGSRGLSRTELGKAAKCSAASVTRALQDLSERRFIHQSSSKRYFIMSMGEADLAMTVAKVAASCA